MGTSTMVSSVVQDWNKGRNKAQEMEGKDHNEEETKKKWEKCVKNKDSSDVPKLNGANKDGDGIAREIDSSLKIGAEESFGEQKINSGGKAKDGELKRKARKVDEGFAEVDEEVYAMSKEMYAKDNEEGYAKGEEMYAKESEEMYAMNEEVYAKAKESCFCWPPSGPSQSKSRQMPKEKKSFPGSKNQLNSLHKAAGEEYFSWFLPRIFFKQI